MAATFISRDGLQASTTTEDALGAWSAYLEDAPVPMFPRRTGSAGGCTPSALLRQRIVLPRKPRINVGAVTILRAAWSLVNAYYSDGDDVVFGLAVVAESDEEAQESERAALPARFILDKSQSVAELARSIEEDVIPLRRFENVTIDDVAGLNADTRTATDFQNQLILYPDSMDFAPVELDRPVNVECELRGRTAILQALYDPHVIDSKQMRRTLKTFESLMDQLYSASPDALVGDLASLSAEDMSEITHWNRALPAPVDERMHDLVARQVEANPDAPAICSFDGDFTYAALDGRSGALASFLAREGVEPGSTVAMMFEKSPWAVFAMLAVLRAGAAFVPLDPGHAWTDTAQILESSGSTMVLCSPVHSKRFEERNVRHAAVGRNFLNDLPAVDPVDTPSRPADPGYIIFTSGSTGKPKGIVCSHRAWCTNALAHGVAELITARSRCLQFSAYTFDISISDIFTTLAFGACICIPSDAERMNDLAGAMTRMRVDQAALTPTVAQFLRPESVPHLRILKVGGEAMTAEFVVRWADKVQLMNSYGPAECTSRSSCTWVGKGDDPTAIGQAIGGVLWVTDAHDPQRLAPIGAVGELMAEGHTLADGYLNDEAKTGAAFINGPAWLRAAFPERAGRVYRTGDLVQYTTDGKLRFVGRRDTQIKVHGVRLEPGHVEAKIRAHLPPGGHDDDDDDDNDVVVVVDKITVDGQDQQQSLLAAFLQVPGFGSPEDGADARLVPLGKEIRSFLTKLKHSLTESLPSYMMPNCFVPLLRIPTGATGKTNRRALQAVARSIPREELNRYATMEDDDDGEVQVTTTELQSALKSLWATVLGLTESSIGLQDTFFGLGGDSLSAMKAVAAAGDHDIALTVSDIFLLPRLADLARHLQGSVNVNASSTSSIEPFALVGGPGQSELVREQISSKYKIAGHHIEDVYPCAPMQEALMAGTMANPAAYLLQEVLRVAADIGDDKLKDCWEEVIRKTPILRTRIVTLGRFGSCQVIMKATEPVIWHYGNDLNQYLHRDRETLMSYGENLNRLAVVRPSKNEQYLVWTAHHAITDGWMHNEVLEQVERLCVDQPSRATTSYNHFIKYLAEAEPSNQESYWQTELSNLDNTSFPDWSPSYEPMISQYLKRPLSLKRENNEVTVSILLRAAWALVIAQHAGSADVVLGVTQAGRDIAVAGIDHCLGPTLTTVPVRIRLDYSESCVQYLERLQRQYTMMIPHQHVGLRTIKKFGQECSNACDFHNLLVVQPEARESEILRRHDSRNAGDQLNFGLLLECILGPDGVALNVGFDPNVISSTMVERVMSQLERVAQQLTTKGNERVLLSHIDVVGPKDAGDLAIWNPRIEPLDECMHWMVERQVDAHPDSAAVDAWDGRFTYRELNNHADRLASHLTLLGVGPETVVPFSFEKSAWTVVALLAILKAGGACVALDVSHPRSRHAKIVSDAGAKVIVASDRQAKFIDLGTQVVAVGPASLAALRSPSNPAASSVSPRNPAFVVYSSGSTGTPKGTVLEHASLCTTSRTNLMHLNFGRSTRVIQFAAYAFDVAIEENIMTLMYGGCVCIPSDDERLDDLAGAMRRMNVNWADLTPTIARTLSPSTVPCLKTLVMGGEALSQDIIDSWAASINLINTYGPSECSVQCTASRSLDKSATGANIGHAVNCNLWVVDAENHDRLLPVGCVGELLIEGPIVGRGYLQESEKTKAAFVEGLSWAKPRNDEEIRRRFYKTGDLAKYNEDGSLDCLGRKDTQVKIYGQRIELGEIEHGLKKNFRGGDFNVVVEAFHPCSSPDRKLLVAFFSDAKPGPASVLKMSNRLRAEFTEVKSAVAQVLPEYMIPSLYVPMSSLPTNSSGKVDRKTLRLLAENFDHRQLSSCSLAESTKAAASTDNERSLRELWADVLRIDLQSDPIGSNDSFLQLGGDSIAAMQLVGRARQAGLELSVSDIFRAPKLAEMASFVRNRNTTTPETHVGPATAEPDTIAAVERDPYVPFQMVSKTISRRKILQSLEDTYDLEQQDVLDVYPCTPMQEGLMALTAENSAAYVLQEAFELPNAIDLARFKAAWAAIVRGNEILRTRIVLLEGLGSCQVVIDEKIQWQRAASLDDYLARDHAEPMTYGKPLARYTIVNDGARKHFVWSLHHALYDGYSYSQTLEAVQTSYDANTQRLRFSPFSSFVQYLSEIDPLSTQSYWRDELEGLETAIFPRPIPGHRSAVNNSLHHTMTLPKLSNSGLTTSSILRAAWSLVISRYSDCDDIVFGMTQSGRDVSLHDIETVMGPTITTAPVRVRIRSTEGTQAFLHRIQDQYVDMIQHSHAGLRHIKKLSASAQVACEFQNLLVIQPGFSGAVEGSIFSKPGNAANAGFLTGYGIVVECELHKASIGISAHHDSKMISSIQMKRMLYQFEHVVSQLCQKQGQVDDIESFCEADKAEISRLNSAYPDVVSKCIHQIIQQQGEKRPTAVAIESREGSISYAELDRLTNHLAHELQDAGVGPESFVSICLEKSSAAILAMLAIQKAGGAFVPLNPKDPIERLRNLAEQTDARVTLCSEQTQQLAADLAASSRLMTLSTDFASWETARDDPVNSQVRPSNAAYALFTSGSTGRPKAVVIEHRAVSSSTAGHGEAMQFGLHPRRVLQFASYTFDACIAEIFTTLTHGGCVCVPSEHERMNSLAQFMNDFKVDWAFFTPSFVATIRPEDVPALKTLVLGGEALTRNNVDVWGDKVHLMNGYGPTETCVFCVTRVIPGPLKGVKQSPETIGHAVSSLSWVVDPTNPHRLAPVGCVGELLVQGPGLARGYLNDPEKTAVAFIQSPQWLHDFGHSKPQKMYKTGDLVRYSSDGTLIYMGRKDSQVKVNGQRLELGEIENQIKSKSTKLAQVISIVGKPKNAGSRQILAVFLQFKDIPEQCHEQLVPLSERVRLRLQDLEAAAKLALASYMVPSLWIPLQSVPTQVSGKTDRKALGVILEDLSAEQLSIYALAKPSAGVFRAPVGEMEQAIQHHVAKVLSREAASISADDSFFQLGGDSITAIQLVASARADGIVLTTEDVFRQPSIAEIARTAKTGDSSILEEEYVAPYSLLPNGLQDEVLQCIADEYSIGKAGIEDVLPPTPLQEGFLAMTMKDSEAYVLRDIFRLPFHLDIERLKAAWNIVARNNPILRTTIVNLESTGCWQVVLHDNISWRYSNNLDDYVEDDKLHSFRYGMPLVRLAIVDDKWNGRYLVWTMHHALYDGWSYELMLKKVQEAYTTTTSTTAVQPFLRFIKYIEATSREEARSFWRSQFSGLEMVEFPRAHSPTFEPLVDKTVSVEIPLLRKQSSRFTIATILKAAWALVLSRYAGAKEATFGVTQNGRNAPLPGITEMVGPTITTVPFRVKIDGQGSVAGLLDSIQNQSTDMIRFEQTGLQHIRRMSEECSEACNFGTLLVIQPGDNAADNFLGSQKIDDQGTGFWRLRLGMECTLKGDTIQVMGGFDSRLICEVQMRRILHQFKEVVHQLNLEDTQAVDNLNLVSPEDKAELLEWNHVVPEAIDACAHDVIHRTILKTPNALAVNAWDVDLRYWELDSLSTKLAHQLRSMGIGPESIVPLCFEKSGWSVVALLAVMKAGGAFVFLDPGYPVARLQEIVNQVGSKIVLTSLAQAGLWNSKLQVQIVDEVSLELLPLFSEIPESGVTPENALYVIFTSGSTGKPKGCVVQHSNFLTGAKAQVERASMTSTSRVLQIASYSFDVSILEMVTAMTVGACICVPNQRAKGKSIAAVINDLRITWAFLTPSVVKLLKPSDVPNLKTLILGGEALTTHNVETWAEHVQLANGYGPSECSIAAAGNPNLKPTTDPANIGKAVGGVCWITEADNHNRLAPLGTTGEILIEGPIVARGYLNNPDKTAEVFIENPAWTDMQGDQPPRRMYKTGDLAYFNGDGSITFVGRKDTQVKVRGQRLELGEIETHLSLRTQVQHAAVLYPRGGPCKQKLVAVLSLKSLGASPSNGETVELIGPEFAEAASLHISEISAHLSNILPSYMVPSLWIVVGNFPFLLSGKLNRKRIEQWIAGMDEPTYRRVCGLTDQRSFDAPSTILEKQLQKIWSDVLRLPVQDIGVKQSFTSLGGDSILAMRVVSQCRKQGVNINLTDVMNARMISQLALRANASSTPTTVVEEKTDELFELTPIQEFYATVALNDDYLSSETNLRFHHTFCLRVRRPIMAADLSRALEALVDRHSMLRARFRRDAAHQNRWMQLISNNAADSFRFRAWNNISLKLAKPCIKEARLSLDIEKGPILGADLVSVDDSEQYFFIVVHHLVVDMVSWSSIVHDLEELLMTGTLTNEKPFSFYSWAQLQREYAAEHLKPETALPIDILPADFKYWNMEGRANVARDLLDHTIQLSVDDTTALLQTCKQYYESEPMDILVSALSHAFSFIFKDRSPPTVFRYGHGREPWTNRIDLSRTVGWFTTFSPIHISTKGREDSITFLRRAISTRKKIPANGWNYFASRYQHADGPKVFAGHEQMEVTINYLGNSQDTMRQEGSLFELVPNFEGGGLSAAGQDVKCFSLFAITASVVDGCMVLKCSWNGRARHQDSIARWFRVFERLLRDVALRAVPKGIRNAQGVSRGNSSEKKKEKARGSVKHSTPKKP